MSGCLGARRVGEEGSQKEKRETLDCNDGFKDLSMSITMSISMSISLSIYTYTYMPL